MVSTKMMMVMVLSYTIIVLTSLYEKNYARALYFLGAIILNIGILMI